MLNINKQTLDYELVNEYISSLPGYEHSRLLTTKDLPYDENLLTYRYGEKPEGAPAGIPVASFRDDKGKLCICQTKYNHHTLTVATTGRGKTQGNVLNIAYNADKHMSYIFVDPKNEICKMSYSYLCNLYGKENIQIVNFLDPAHTTAFMNPFTDFAVEWVKSSGKPNKMQIRDRIISEISKICEVLYPVTSQKDPTWEQTGRSLILAIIYGLFEDLELTKEESADTGRSRTYPQMINFATLERVFNSIRNTRSGVQDNGFFSSRSKTSLAFTTSYSIISNADSTRANYFGFAHLYIKMYSNPKIQEISKYNTVIAADYAKSPKVLFLIYDITDENLREFVNTCVAKLVSDLLELSHKNGKGIALETPIHFVFDEFATLRACGVYQDLLTVGRGSNIYMHMYIQSHQQLAEKYPEKYRTMIENCDLQMFLGTNGIETAESFAKGLGKCAKVDPAAFVMGSLNVVELPVVTQDELMHRMNRGDCYIKRNGAMPLKVGYELYYKTEEYTKFGLFDTDKLKAKPIPETRTEYILPHDVEDDEDENEDDVEDYDEEEDDNEFMFDKMETEECEEDEEAYSEEDEYVSIEEIENKKQAAINDLLNRKYRYVNKNQFESLCMDVIEVVAGISPVFTRQDAIVLLDKIIEMAKGLLSENTLKIFQRVKEEFTKATNDEYELLQKQLFK